MNKQDFLLEIGCEEIPARYVSTLVQQLENNMIKWLNAHRISYQTVQAFSTPRRLAVLIQGVSEKQADLHEEVKGPAARIAKTADGSWSKAAEGFARKNGVSTDQLELKEFKGETYVFAHVHQPGATTVDEMTKHLHEVMNAFQPPKTMRWGDHFRFVRPVRWMVALFGDEIVPVHWVGVTASNLTRGHRFLGKEVIIPSASKYEEVLRGQYVVANASERKDAIMKQLKQLEEEHGWEIPVDPGLLEEVTNLVEYPTALTGSFAEEYLVVPDAVLITTMREHQRYFPVQDHEGKLLPYFVTVRNGDHQNLEIVAKGNEKVLRARLADARFFYDEDLKLPIADAMEKLDHIVFFEGLGTMGDRVRRIRHLANQMGQMLHLDETMMMHLNRAASICKFDLSTQMIGEFPELEGYMGRMYAEAAGEAPEVAKAIYEHHLPRFAGDDVPSSLLGTILSVADKLDTLCASFGIGMQVTGSQDPYGLRRRATAVLQVLLGEYLRELSIPDLVHIAYTELQAKGLGKEAPEKVTFDLHNFFVLRFRTLLQEAGIRYDVVEAIIEAGFPWPALAMEKAQVLAAQLEREEFKHEVDGFTRVENLSSKANESKLQTDLLIEPAEKQLLKALQHAQEGYQGAWEAGHVLGMYHALAGMTPEIHDFFDRVMVMVEEEKTRNNRLALLHEITKLTNRFASFGKIVFPS